VIYLLDANVLIRAHEDYYPIERVPQFWQWLQTKADEDRVKIPFEIHGELSVYAGPLKQWITDPTTAKKLIHDAQIDPVKLNHVIDTGYAPDLNATELVKIGQDPFLIAYALDSPPDFTVVTKEVSAPSKLRANRKVPDVCLSVGVRCISDFEFFRELNFTTT
jgi:hypothetical protein